MVQTQEDEVLEGQDDELPAPQEVPSSSGALILGPGNQMVVTSQGGVITSGRGFNLPLENPRMEPRFVLPPLVFEADQLRNIFVKMDQTFQNRRSQLAVVFNQMTTALQIGGNGINQ